MMIQTMYLVAYYLHHLGIQRRFQQEKINQHAGHGLTLHSFEPAVAVHAHSLHASQLVFWTMMQGHHWQEMPSAPGYT